MSSILRGSPKRALSFETEARDHLASWLEVKPVFASKDPLSFFQIR
jgi:site-specific recombinase XerC